MSSSTQVDQEKGDQENDDQENDDQEIVARQSYDQYMRYRRAQIKEIEKQPRSKTQQKPTC